MAKFTVTATIVVEGSAVRSKKGVLEVLQTMLDDFDDMNSDLDASVCITPAEIKKVAPEK